MNVKRNEKEIKYFFFFFFTTLSSSLVIITHYPILIKQNVRMKLNQNNSIQEFFCAGSRNHSYGIVVHFCLFFFFVLLTTSPPHTFWEQALGGGFFCSFFVCRERERENDSWWNMYVCMYVCMYVVERER